MKSVILSGAQDELFMVWTASKWICYKFRSFLRAFLFIFPIALRGISSKMRTLWGTWYFGRCSFANDVTSSSLTCIALVAILASPFSNWTSWKFLMHIANTAFSPCRHKIFECHSNTRGTFLAWRSSTLHYCFAVHWQSTLSLSHDMTAAMASPRASSSMPKTAQLLILEWAKRASSICRAEIL